MPVGLDIAVLDQGVDIAGQCQRGHIGLDTVDDGACLLARAAMRLLDSHILVLRGLPVLGERLVVVHIERHVSGRRRR